jgi:hypothetical protein
MQCIKSNQTTLESEDGFAEDQASVKRGTFGLMRGAAEGASPVASCTYNLYRLVLFGLLSLHARLKRRFPTPSADGF